MASKKSLYLAVALISVVAISGNFAWRQIANLSAAAVGSSTDLQRVLGEFPSTNQYHLFSGAIDDASRKALVPGERSIDIFGQGGVVPSATFVANKDQSSVNSHYDQRGVLSDRETYYPGPAGTRRLHIKSNYFADAKLKDEDVRHEDGTPARLTQVQATGGKHVLEFASDGMTILDDAHYVPDACCADLIVKTEQRFSDDGRHQLVYDDVLNADGTRRISQFDEHLHEVRTEMWAAGGEVPGTIITDRYHDTLRPRFVSRSDSQWTTVDYFRHDETLQQRVLLNAAQIRVMVFDSTGKHALFEQVWGLVMTSGDNGMVARWFLSDVSDFDSQGNKIRSLMYNTNGLVLLDIKYNVIAGGITYQREALRFDDQGFLKSDSFVLKGNDDLAWLNATPDREILHTPADKIRADVPPLETKPLDYDTQLPVPRFQGHEH